MTVEQYCFLVYVGFIIIIQKKGKLLISHRYNLLTLLRSRPGEIQRELVVQDLPECKSTTKKQFRNTKRRKNV